MTRDQAKRITFKLLPKEFMFSGELLAMALAGCNRKGDIFKFQGIVYEIIEHMVTVNVIKTRTRLDLPTMDYPELTIRLEMVNRRNNDTGRQTDAVPRHRSRSQERARLDTKRIRILGG